MRRSLKTKFNERANRSNLRIMRSDIERNRWALSRIPILTRGFNASSIGTPSAAGSSGYYSDAEHAHEYSGINYLGVVDSLPAIPASLPAICHWTSIDAGTGDDQSWYADPEATDWQPMEKATILSGTP